VDFGLIYDIGGFTNQGFKNELPRYLMVGSKNEPSLRAIQGFKNELPCNLMVGSASEPTALLVNYS